MRFVSGQRLQALRGAAVPPPQTIQTLSPMRSDFAYDFSLLPSAFAVL